MKRVEKLVEIIREKGLDALFLMRDANIRYVSGFTGSESFVLIGETGRIFITDSRYTEQAEQECPGFEIIRYRNPMPGLEETIAKMAHRFKIKKLGFEQDFVTYEIYDKMRHALKETDFVPTLGLAEEVRYVKDAGEIKLIRQAARIADDAFTHILNFIRPGVSEKDIALELEYTMKKSGADATAFQTIVASGPRGSLPHAIPSRRLVARGDFVTMDFGALYEGYRSDITRTVVVGEPTEKQREIYELVKAAQAAGLAAVKAGVPGVFFDKAARGLIAAAGYGDYFGHGLGHGVGLEIHEEPFVNPKCQKILAAGVVVTVEPGVYLPNWGGVRIEDTVLVTEDGSERLTTSSRELVILS